jgi:hypothetical protein
MTTFHPQQFNRGRCAHQKAGASALQNSVTNCTAKLRGSAHEAGKSSATIFKEQCKSTSLNLNFRHRKPYPLSKQGFCGSLRSRHWTRGVPRDGHAMAVKHLARHPAKFLAANPNHVPAMAGQWQRQCRRTSGKSTRKVTCVAPDMDVRCPRRKFARQLATRSRDSHATVRATSRKATRSNFNHDIQKL